MDAAWISEYKREIDRERRRRILEREKEAHGGEPEYEIRKKIWEARYDKKNGQNVDYGIRGWVNFQSMKRRIYMPGESKRLRKEIEGVKKDWGFDLCREYGEAGEKALLDELFNIALFYFEDLPVKEITRILHMASGTVRYTLTIARRHLKDYITL